MLVKTGKSVLRIDVVQNICLTVRFRAIPCVELSSHRDCLAEGHDALRDERLQVDKADTGLHGMESALRPLGKDAHLRRYARRCI